jgi:eukaryotic-like serine/threonine-protein kinase
MSNPSERPPTPGGAGTSRPEGGGEGGDIPAAGDVIAGKYEVERVLGVGGMGVVVSARHLQLGQRVAVKFMRGEAARDPNAANRFLREARAAVALSSEHVTKVLDVGTLQSGAPFMVMEYLSGGDLAALLHRSGPMSVADALNYVLQACEAIAEAHARGIVHRDLKPSNLFVTQHVDGTPLVKVLDFGISKMVEFNAPQGGGHSLTASGAVMGSPMYMSPEQVRDAKAVDARSDIWALGIILYELFTGRTPFEGNTLGDTLARIIADPVKRIREVRGDIPEGLDAIVMRCLERRAERRIQTVGELAGALLPFAPRETEPLVQRIMRLSRTSGSETMTVLPSSAGARNNTPGTEPPWHRSDTATSHASGLPANASKKRWAIFGGVAAVVITVGAVAIYSNSARNTEHSTATPANAANPPGATAAPTEPATSVPAPTAAPGDRALVEDAGAGGSSAEGGPAPREPASAPLSHSPSHKPANPSTASGVTTKPAPPVMAPQKKSHYEDF